MSSLLIDLGGTDLKLGIVRKGNTEIESFIRVSMPKLVHSSPLRAELSLKQTLQTLDPLIKTFVHSENDLRNILVSGQMGCWTIENLTSFSDKVVSWQDRRILESYSNLAEVISVMSLESIIESNGNEIGLGVPLVGMLSLLPKTNFGVSDLNFQSLISWTTSQLAKRSVTPMHITDAAASGMVNLETNCWNQAALDTLFKGLKFPEIIKTLTPIGNFDDSRIEIYCGVGDQQASLLGAGLSEETLVLNIGTGGQVASLRESPKGANIRKRPFFEGEMIHTVTHLLSGRFLNIALDVVSSVLGEKWSHQRVNAMNVPEGASFPLFDFELALDREYLSDFASTLGAEKFLQSSILTMASNYVYAIEELGGISGRKLIFAGGVGQKNVALVTTILRKLRQPKFEISQEVETTLSGLRALSKRI